MTWPGAGEDPFNNITETDPELIDPENGDYRLQPGSPAQGYGCQSAGAPLSQDACRVIPYMEPLRQRTRTLMQVSGIIAESQLWDADTVQVTGDVTIADGATVQIAAGSVVWFDDYYRITLQGALQAVGTPEQRILFTSRFSQFFTLDDDHTGAWHGIRFDDPHPANEPSRLEYCILQYSKATADETRGAVLSINGMRELVVANCIFRNNVADVGGAIYCERYAAPLFASNLFHHNYALYSGSVLYNNYAYPRLYNNTMADNTVLNGDEWYRTGVVYNHISKPKLVNNIFWNNTSAYYEDTEFRELKPFYSRYNSTTWGEGGEGTLNGDPGFINATELDYRLGADSSCRDAGDDEALWIALPALDLDGNPRILGTVDMGCYEMGTTHAHAPVVTKGSLAVWPNPAASALTRQQDICIQLTLPAADAQEYTCSIYNVRGQTIAQLKITTQDRNVQFFWNGKTATGQHCAAGVYLLNISTNSASLAKGKLLILP